MPNVQPVSTHLKAHGEGLVSCVMIKDDGRNEIWVMLADRCKIVPQRSRR
ncbi:MAG: hypothetical protein Q8S27_02970 [Hoeflea sp.]|nr:hypothetical protein [Hoeflea sp.]